MGIETKRSSANKHNSHSSRKNRTCKPTRASHFEPLEHRQMLSAVLPSAPPTGSAKLTGTLIGTAGSYQGKGNTIAMAVDGNTNTYFDAPSGVQGWIGYDLGSPETITQVQFVPRGGYASRMVGGMFQGSDTADFSADVTTLFTVTTTPGSAYTAGAVTSTDSFRYVRYLAPVTGSGNVAELVFDGLTPAPGSVAPVLPVVPVAPVLPATPSTPTSLVATNVSVTDVHLAWQEDASSVTSYTILRQGPSRCDLYYRPARRQPTRLMM